MRREWAVKCIYFSARGSVWNSIHRISAQIGPQDKDVDYVSISKDIKDKRDGHDGSECDAVPLLSTRCDRINKQISDVL